MMNYDSKFQQTLSSCGNQLVSAWAEGVHEGGGIPWVWRRQFSGVFRMGIVRRPRTGYFLPGRKTDHLSEELPVPYANNQGVRIHYEVEGSGPPLILHHGSFGSGLDWREFGYTDALKQDHQLILIDARGHGASASRGSARARC